MRWLAQCQWRFTIERFSPAARGSFERQLERPSEKLRTSVHVNGGLTGTVVRQAPIRCSAEMRLRAVGGILMARTPLWTAGIRSCVDGKENHGFIRGGLPAR